MPENLYPGQATILEEQISSMFREVQLPIAVRFGPAIAASTHGDR